MNKQSISIGRELKVQGFYTLRKRCALTGKVKQEVGPFRNKITNIGLNRAGSGTILTRCYVGTGTNPASETDTTMGTFTVSTGTITSVATAPVSPTWFAQAAYTCTFAAGAISGNITEVGVGWATSPLNALWSRELIVDGSGNPITLTVLSNEILDVVYTIRYYLDTADFSGSFTLNSIVYNYTGRITLAGSHRIQLSANPQDGPGIIQTYGTNMALGPITGNPTGTISDGGSPTQLAYTNGSYSRDCRTNWVLTQGNLAGGLKGFTTSTASSSSPIITATHQFLLATPIPKTNLNTFSITMRITWARYTGTITP